MTAGDVGFNFLVKAMNDNDQNELLDKMNASDDVPGYGYQLKKGATALTESWPALEVVSNNHLMLGHLMEWFYSGLGGIGQTENSVAYKEIKIEPRMVSGIQSAKVTYESPYGTIFSSWENVETKFNLSVEIPVNSMATVVLPAKSIENIFEGGHLIQSNSNFKISKTESKVTIELGSGKYQFEVKKE